MKNLTIRGVKKGTIVYVHGNSSSYKVFSEALNSKKIKQTQIAVMLLGHEDAEQDSNSDNFSIIKQKKLLMTFVNNLSST